MRDRVIRFASLLVLTAASAGRAAAQDASVGLSAGVSVPVGSGSDVVETGYQVAGHLVLRGEQSPLGLRFDVSFNRWEIADLPANVRSIAGTVNGMFFVGTGALRPYLLGGVGVYNLRGSFDFTPINPTRSSSETHFGVNGGLGLDFQLGGVATFVEARYNSVFTDGPNTNFVPVSVGVRF